MYQVGSAQKDGAHQKRIGNHADVKECEEAAHERVGPKKACDEYDPAPSRFRGDNTRRKRAKTCGTYSWPRRPLRNRQQMVKYRVAHVWGSTQPNLCSVVASK